MKKIVSLILAALLTASSAVFVTASDVSLSRDASPVLGDLNGDKTVDVNDAMVLFQHSMLPEMFPVDYPGTLDMEKDGNIDINDALCLFRYSTLPDTYPIEWGEEYTSRLLTENGVALAKIVVAEGASATEKFAAEELAYHVKTVSGAEPATVNALSQEGLDIVIATPDSMPELETLFPDDLAWLRELGEVGDTERWGDDGFAIRTLGGKIYIFGATARGALNGVYDFIEENLGVLWIRADVDKGLIYDEMPTIFAAKTDYREKSPFQVRVVNRYGHASSTTPAAMDLLYSRSRYNLGSTHAVVADVVVDAWVRESSVGLEPFISNHNVKWWLASSPIYDPTIDEYWETNKEGVHGNYNSSRQVNYWSELTAETIAATVTYFLDYYHDSFNWRQVGICMEDLGFATGVYPEMNEPFEYAPGQFVEPSDPKYLSTVYFTFINRIARKVAEKYPDVMLNTFAYSFSEPAPLCEIEDNVLVIYCHYTEDLSQRTIDVTFPGSTSEQNYTNFSEWAEKTTNIINYNYYGCYFTSGWYERPIWYRVQNDFQLYAEHGMVGLTPTIYNDDGNPFDLFKADFTNGDIWSMNILTHWIISKLAWNPYEDVDALIVEFCDKVYGDASEHMQEYYRLLTIGWDYGATALTEDGLPAYMFRNYPLDYLDYFIDVEVDGVHVLEEIQAALERAWEAADEEAKAYISRPRECLADPEVFI